MKLIELKEAKETVEIQPFIDSTGKPRNATSFNSGIPKLDYRPEGNPVVINRQRTAKDNADSKKYVANVEKDLKDFRKYLEDNNLMAPYASTKITAFTHAEKVLSIAKLCDGIVDQFNSILGKLNKAAEVDDIEAFSNANSDLRSLVLRNNQYSKFIKSRMGLPGIVSPLRAIMATNFEYMSRARDSAASHLKRMKMSPAQREAAHKASVRMKMAWLE